MLTTSSPEYYVLTQEKGVDVIRLGGHYGHRRLKEDILHRPSVNFDLNEGIERRNDTLERQMRLNVFLKWIIMKAPHRDLKKVLNGAKFVCRKGILSRMALTRLTGKDWTVYCERRGGAIFMFEEMNRSVILEHARCSENEKRAMFWGHRFEDYMIEDVDVTESEDDLVGRLSTLSLMNTGLDVRMVVVTTLKNAEYSTKILLTGEADAVDSDGRPVELKTMSENTFNRRRWRKEKGPAWWAQSYIAGIENIVLGLRDQHGFVKKVMKLPLLEVNDNSWSGDDCLNDLLDILRYIDRSVREGEAAMIGSIYGRPKLRRIDPREAEVLTKEFRDHFRL